MVVNRPGADFDVGALSNSLFVEQTILDTPYEHAEEPLRSVQIRLLPLKGGVG